MTDYLNLPEISANPPEQHMDCYEWSERESLWCMNDVAREHIARCKSELDELNHNYLLARMTLDEVHNKDKAALRERVLDSALQAALEHAGVSEKMRKAASMFLQKEWKFAIDGDAVSVAHDGNGATIDLNTAVADWAAGDTGTPFQQRKPTKSVNTFSNRLSEIIS